MSEFLEALENVGQQDVADIEAEIKELKAQVAKLIAAKRIVVKLVGKGPTFKRKYTTGGLTTRDKICSYILAAGKSSIAAIGTGIGQEPKNLYTPLNHEFFTKLADGTWNLTEEGRAHAKTLTKG